MNYHRRPIIKAPDIDRKAKGYEQTDQCATCLYSDWYVYAVVDAYWYSQTLESKPRSYHLAKSCLLVYKNILKLMKDCKQYIHQSEQQFFSNPQLRHRKTYQQAKVEAMVKTEDISEFILPAMLSTHGNIIALQPNNGDPEHCGYIRPAKDTPFNRDVTQFDIKFAKDGLTKKYTMNKTTFKKCAETWGDDSDKWVGKQLSLTVVKQAVRGELRDVIFGVPVKQARPKKAKGD